MQKDVVISTYGSIDDRSLQQLMRCMAVGDALYGVLCADHHPGYAQPIGSAIAYKNKISVSGVGYDIGCGNSAIRLDLSYDDIADDLPKIMDEIYSRVSFGMGRTNNKPVNDPVIDEIANANFIPQRSLLELARQQLGTVGGGNHYVDLFVDNYNKVWIGTHFGSRGFGHKTANGFISLSKGGKFDERASEGEMDSDPILLDVDSDLGRSYISAMELAGEYARAGRFAVLREVLDILDQASVLEIVNNHHNFAWQETHFGESVWVVRKGCTPLFPDNRLSFIGSNMRDTSYIVKGRDTQEAKESLYSTVHGAGRIMSRRAAAGKTKYVNGVKTVIKPGLIDWEATKKGVRNKLIELRGGGPDEAPEVYKNLNEVLSYHADSTQEVYALHPIGVAMAGDDTYDPYKD